MTTTLILTIMMLALVPLAQGGRSLATRLTWLEARASLHRYVCRHGARANQRWHCLALVWTRRELKEARHENWLRLPATGDWLTAVALAQRPFPGTSRWLLSCSASEGGHGRWVRYGGGSYYAGYERTDAVGGWMQFRPSTYYAYVGRALAHVRTLGFTVPTSARSWLSPLGQALTGGYMRKVVGNSGWHWRASVDAGCG